MRKKRNRRSLREKVCANYREGKSVIHFFSNVINGEKGNDGGRMEFGEIFDYRGIDGIEIEKVGKKCVETPLKNYCFTFRNVIGQIVVRPRLLDYI